MSIIEDRENFLMRHLGMTSEELWEDWEKYSKARRTCELVKKGEKITVTSEKTVLDGAKGEHSKASEDLLDNRFLKCREMPTFGSDIPWEKGEVLTDNRGVCLREDDKRKGWCEERERTGSVTGPRTPQKAGVKLYVDTVTGCKDGLVVRFRRHNLYFKYIGRKRLDDVKSLTFSEDFVPDSEHLIFDDDDIVLIDGTALGHGDSSAAWAGVYAIRLPKERKWKVAQHGDLFPSLRRDLSNPESLNWKAGVKLRGVSGVRIYVSRHIGDEEERKDEKRKLVAYLREKGFSLYNNEKTESDGSEPVGEYTALGGFKYRIGHGEWNVVNSTDIIGDICRIYGSKDGWRLGMEIYIK